MVVVAEVLLQMVVEVEEVVEVLMAIEVELLEMKEKATVILSLSSPTQARPKMPIRTDKILSSHRGGWSTSPVPFISP